MKEKPKGSERVDLKEVKNLPPECEQCTEECYNCDYAGKRWILSEKEELLLRRKMLLRAVVRYQREIEIIDKQLQKMEQTEQV